MRLLLYKHSRYFLLSAILWIFTGAFSQSADIVNGNLIQFSENGGWCWYQDERVVVDSVNGRILVASLANRYGVGGNPKDGDVDVSLFDLHTRASKRVTLKDGFTSYGGGDDHNVAALLLRPSGGYLAMYAGHNNDNLSYYRFSSPTDISNWGPEKEFDWNTMPGGTNFATSYSNLFYLSAEKRIYNFARTDKRSPNFMVSTDEGANWTYGGQLTAPNTSIGYVNGYFKYASNGIDRIDFLATEHHPRDFNTSLFHGYIKGGKSYNSENVTVDENVFDKTAPLPAAFTPVFRANTPLGSVNMTRCWNIDIQHYPDGTLATVFKCRANDSEMDHRFIFARLKDGKWTSSPLARAGDKLFGREQDYTGLAAIDPKDPFTVFISTPIDPNTNTVLNNHEIYKGVSGDLGATWSWTALTSQSSKDNYRPVVPIWNSNNTALIWFRGTMTSSQNYDGAMVGLLLADVQKAAKNYVDATSANTKLLNGSPFTPSGPTAEMGPADDNWHHRTSFGNGGSVYTSAESEGEDSPTLRTDVTVTRAGAYDIWVHFWANPTSDWRIKAGLNAKNMQVFRSMASRQVTAGEHVQAIVIKGSANTHLYQAYLGRVEANAGALIPVYVDDEAVKTGTESPLVGDISRTWYDGVSYRQVVQTRGFPTAKKTIQKFHVGPVKTRLNLAEIKVELSKTSKVVVDIHKPDGRRVLRAKSLLLDKGKHSLSWHVPSRLSGMYVIRVLAEEQLQSRLWIVP